MKDRRGLSLSLPALAALLLAVAIPAGAQPKGAGKPVAVDAKTAYDTAKAAAVKWQADAELFGFGNLSTGPVDTEGRSTAWVRTGDSGGRATFHFCPDCGATVHYELAGHEEVVAIPVGAFADPGFAPPAFSVYESRKHAWVALAGDIEHLD